MPMHRPFKHGIVKNSVQLKEEIFKPFREKRKQRVKAQAMNNGKPAKPTITDFEVGLLNEFVESRYGLKKRVTAYDMLLAKAAQAARESQELAKSSPKKKRLVNRSLPELSFMSDRNPYLIDFGKSVINHGKDIVESISRNPKFQRSNLNQSQDTGTVAITESVASLPRMRNQELKASTSQSSINMQK